jgi:hypothetical protein
MASDKPSPALIDAVKAQALKIKEMKNLLDARRKEVDALHAELEARGVELSKREASLEAERVELAKEKEQVATARAVFDKDVFNLRMERDKFAEEERRIQDWARTLTEREESTKERADQVKRLEHELTDHLKESERKIETLVEREEAAAQRERALAETIDRLSVMEKGLADRDRKLGNREEELIKLQNERLVALEAREREILKISEDMFARQTESLAQHESFVELQGQLKEELIHLASEREKLAVKERSLLEAERFITAALEATGIDIPEPEVRTPPPPPAREMEPPRPPAPRGGSSAPQPLHDEIYEEEEPAVRPKVSRGDALERMTRALETAKRARDSGRNVGEIRKGLKQARAAFESGDYDTASRLAEEILKELEAVAVSR